MRATPADLPALLLDEDTDPVEVPPLRFPSEFLEHPNIVEASQAAAAVSPIPPPETHPQCALSSEREMAGPTAFFLRQDGPEPSEEERGLRRRIEHERQVCLISLFDGMGTAMHAVCDLLIRWGLLGSLSHEWYVEIDNSLANAVGRVWNDEAERCGRTPRYTRIVDPTGSRGAWVLFQNGARILIEITEEVPRELWSCS